MKVLVVPDKFKGTLAAPGVAQAVAEGWQAGRRGDALEVQPISDGGDGFGELLSSLLMPEEEEVSTVNAVGNPVLARWWWQPAERLAVIESAQIIGLARLGSNPDHPFRRDTRGLGAVLQGAAAKAPERCLIGIGGSATNDAGFGMALSLGWGFLDERGDSIGDWTELSRLCRVVPPSESLVLGEVLVAVDVRNPLLGPEGATRAYGPQKGLRPDDFPHAEACLGRLAEVMGERVGCDLASLPGSGAAGGLGFGLAAFLGARLESGFQLFCRWSGLGDKIRSSDLVITGEGAVDETTFMGKGVGEVVRLCREAGVPCLVFGGRVDRSVTEEAGVAGAYGLVPDWAPEEEASRRPAAHLARLAEAVAGRWPVGLT